MSHKVKTGVFIAGFTALTLAALYPIVVYPKLHPEVYSKSIYLHLFTCLFDNSLRHSILHPHPPNGKHNSDSPFRVPILIPLPHLSAPIQIPTPQCVTEILNKIPNPQYCPHSLRYCADSTTPFGQTAEYPSSCKHMNRVYSSHTLVVKEQKALIYNPKPNPNSYPKPLPFSEDGGIKLAQCEGCSLVKGTGKSVS